jgi:hypothetical protein
MALADRVWPHIVLAPIASVAMADTPASRRADSSGRRVAQRPNTAVVPNTGLCNA